MFVLANSYWRIFKRHEVCLQDTFCVIERFVFLRLVYSTSSNYLPSFQIKARTYTAMFFFFIQKYQYKVKSWESSINTTNKYKGMLKLATCLFFVCFFFCFVFFLIFLNLNNCLHDLFLIVNLYTLSSYARIQIKNLQRSYVLFDLF